MAPAQAEAMPRQAHAAGRSLLRRDSAQHPPPRCIALRPRAVLATRVARPTIRGRTRQLRRLPTWRRFRKRSSLPTAAEGRGLRRYGARDNPDPASEVALPFRRARLDPAVPENRCPREVLPVATGRWRGLALCAPPAEHRPRRCNWRHTKKAGLMRTAMVFRNPQ